jgi:hypothetical protein
MRRKLGFAGVLFALAVPIALTLGITGASGQGDVHLLLQGASSKVAFLDFNHDGDLRLGDGLESTGPLLDHDTRQRAGKAFLHCDVVSHITAKGGMYDCHYILKLEAGTILLRGLDPHGPSQSLLAVVGGTGSYSRARGQAVLTDTRTDSDLVIDISS